MTPAAPLLSVDDLWVEGGRDGEGGRPIVKGVSFQLAHGEVIGLIGESGAGKSTIALAALGYARPGCRIVGGRVTMDSTDILALSQEARRRWRGRHVGYIAQSAAAAFNSALRIDTQLTEGPVVHGLMDRAEAGRRAVELCRNMDLPNPETIGRKFPHQVSGGQLQRLLAIMAVSCSPDLLLLDEPTTAVDVTTQIEVLRTLKRIIQANRTSAIYVTHDLAVVTQIADRIIVLNDGEVVEQGRTDDIIFAPREAYTKQLMAAVRPAPRLSTAVTVRRATAESADAPLLSITGVHAGYGAIKDGQPQFPVLTDVGLTVARGEVVGVIGESGSGKSTLARVIAGLLPFHQGEIRLGGEALPARVSDRPRAMLRRIQLVTQMPDLAFNPRQRIGDILGRPLAFYFGYDRARRRARVAELLDMVALPAAYAERFPAQLSGGEKQRINLARALAAEPEIVLCDEVTSALDTVVTAHVIELLTSLQKRLGISLVFISHDVSTIATFADRIAVLYAGRVAEQGPTDEVLAPPHHPYTRLLLDSVPELRRGWLDEVSRKPASKAAATIDATRVVLGCPFFARCPLAIAGTCNTVPPPVRRLGSGLSIACHREIEELEVYAKTS